MHRIVIILIDIAARLGFGVFVADVLWALCGAANTVTSGQPEDFPIPMAWLSIVSVYWLGRRHPNRQTPLTEPSSSSAEPLTTEQVGSVGDDARAGKRSQRLFYILDLAASTSVGVFLVFGVWVAAAFPQILPTSNGAVPRQILIVAVDALPAMLGTLWLFYRTGRKIVSGALRYRRAQRVNDREDPRKRAGESRRRLIFVMDILAWISFLTLMGTFIWALSGPAHLPEGAKILLAGRVLFALGVWLVDGERARESVTASPYRDESERAA